METYPGDAYESELQQDAIEDQREEAQEEQEASMGEFPHPKKAETLYTLFNKVLRIPDSSKVANLDKNELGDLRLSVRHCQQIALLGTLMRHDKFAQFFNDTGEIVLSTSSSKKGWLAELFVTSKKYASKSASFGSFNNQPNKWKLFGKGNQQEQPAQA